MYYIVALATLGALATAAAPAEVDLTVVPAMVRGAPDAPLAIVEFADYQCPACRSLQQPLARVLAEYAGRVRLVFKDRPLRIHPLARPAHEAARCAGAKDRYWAYHDLLFQEQPAFTRADLLLYAADVGLDGAEFARCLDERRHADAVEADVRQAIALGISATPTLLVGSRTIVGVPTVEELRAAVEDALRTHR